MSANVFLGGNVHLTLAFCISLHTAAIKSLKAVQRLYSFLHSAML